MVVQMHELYPVAIIQDRYSGSYSGGEWLAIEGADEAIAEGSSQSRVAWIIDCNGPLGSDPEASDFWRDEPIWIAVGKTPDKALQALIRKQSGV